MVGAVSVVLLLPFYLVIGAESFLKPKPKKRAE